MSHTYVAGKLGSERVDALYDLLNDAEWGVFDWRDIPVTKPYLTSSDAEPAALFMGWGVQKAAWVIVVVEGERLYGAMVELGMAIAAAGSDVLGSKRITVAMADDAARESVFFMHPEVEVTTYDELVTEIKEQIAEGEEWKLKLAAQN